MKFDYKLNVNDYVAVVEAIADGYFNDVGEYSPQMGRIVAVAVFCDYCMKESVFGDVENPDMDVIFDNHEIMEAYKKALRICDEQLCFANAYDDALELVEYRKSSLTQAVGLFSGIIRQALSPDNLSKLYEISDRFKEVVESNKDNVVDLFPDKGKVD